MTSSSSTAIDPDNTKQPEQPKPPAPKGGRASKAQKAIGVPAPGQAWESRAVIKLIEAGSAAECPHCMERVKFRARHRDQQVICNVYENGAWQRVEQYHLECYEAADSPHGEAVKG
jgi:DNA-directed RNA polymerase subunit RPC12/RpoP